MAKYLFDSNIFIQAKNLHYQFSFCQGFWDWILEGHNHGLFYSSKKVLAELMSGKDGDEAKTWAKNAPASFFLDDASDAGVMNEYANAINWAYSSQHYTDAAKQEFAQANVADAFLIALAKHAGYVIVTHELPNPASRKRILIPDAAIANGVGTVLVYDLLNQKATSTFQLALA